MPRKAVTPPASSSPVSAPRGVSMPPAFIFIQPLINVLSVVCAPCRRGGGSAGRFPARRYRPDGSPGLAAQLDEAGRHEARQTILGRREVLGFARAARKAIDAARSAEHVHECAG